MNNDNCLMILGSIPGNCLEGKSQNRWFFDDSIDDFLMISLSFFKKSSPDRFPKVIKKSSIESSKNHRFFQQFPGMLPKIIKKSSFESSIFSTFPPACHFFKHFEAVSMKTKGISQKRWFFDNSNDDFLMISLSFFKKSSPTMETSMNRLKTKWKQWTR